ncbi:hypothetical protein AJ87_24885 [Rhizobium yanglingense]|nr:hypothetical protein AJ87_24885 [Rhizobium yanglingense]
MNAHIHQNADFAANPAFLSALDEGLVKQIGPQDRSILEVGCADGRFGQKLKLSRPSCKVFGVELVADAAAKARGILDAVYETDLEREMPPVEPASLDCVVVSDGLQSMRDPIDLLCRLKTLIRPGGRLVCAVPNVQHFTALASIIAGDFQYQRSGVLDRAHVRFFATANIQKMFLDAGLLPNFTEAIQVKMPNDAMEAYKPLLKHLKLNAAFFAEKASVYQYICAGSVMPEAPLTTSGITFVAAVNNPRQLQDNLLASPILQDSRHEVIRSWALRVPATHFGKAWVCRSERIISSCCCIRMLSAKGLGRQIAGRNRCRGTEVRPRRNCWGVRSDTVGIRLRACRKSSGSPHALEYGASVSHRGRQPG